MKNELDELNKELQVTIAICGVCAVMAFVIVVVIVWAI